MCPIPLSEGRVPGWIVGALAFLFSFGAIGAMVQPVEGVFRHALGDLRFVGWILASGFVSIAIYRGWAKRRGRFDMMLRVMVTAWFSSIALHWLLLQPSWLRAVQAGQWHLLPTSLILPTHLVLVLGSMIAAILTLAVLKLYAFWRKRSGS